jgi:hypothetical protein
MHRPLRTAIAAAIASLVIAASPAAAFQPSVEIIDFPPSWTGRIADAAGRAGTQAITMDVKGGDGDRVVLIAWSTDGGATWPGSQTIETITDAPHLESQAAVCAGRAIAVYAVAVNPSTRIIRGTAMNLAFPSMGQRDWTSSGVGRKPDAACIANRELAVAWFQKSGSDYKVRLRTGVPVGDDLSPQSFDLGVGTPGRGLSVATTTDRVYVTWFQGGRLKLRRFRIGSGPNHTLTSLGTTSLGTIPGGTNPQVGAAGSRVVVAYTQGADLKVRRSTNRGVSFGTARTLRNLPGASEVGALATTLTMKGDLVALGSVEVGGIETLTGKGVGYKSTNGGATWSKVSSHSGGWLLATLTRPGSSYRWAEVWDRSLSQPSPDKVRFRRQ